MVARDPSCCAWPDRATGSECSKKAVKGLAVCAVHATVIDEGPGEICAWPSCTQSAPFRALCAYHLKRALGLLESFQ